MHLDAMTVLNFDLDMSASSRTYRQNPTILMRVLSMAGVVAVGRNWIESFVRNLYLERRTHWLVGSSQTVVIDVEEHLDSRCCSRWWVLCSYCRRHHPSRGHQGS